MSAKFDRWIDKLQEDVIQTEYGYEPGEFAVYPEHWRGLYKEGLTPSQAFARALKAADDARKNRDQAQRDNWARIQEADRAALSMQPTNKSSEWG